MLKFKDCGRIERTEILHAPDPPMSIWLLPVGMAIAAVLAALVAMLMAVPDAMSILSDVV